jgi:putative hydroxymethylpyrimidine transport system substrate-binding protein
VAAPLQPWRVAALAVVGVAAAFLCGCGDAGSKADVPAVPPPVTEVVFEGRLGAANSALRLADERGYFETGGYRFWTGTPVGPGRPILYVTSETDDIGVTELPQLVIAREEGVPLVAVGSLVRQTTIAMIWLKRSGIRDVRDLKGKTIAIPGLPYQERLLEAVLRRAGLKRREVKIARVGYKLIPALLDGRADAIFGASWNIQGAALEARGVEPVIKRAPALGIPSYDELVLVTRADRVAREPGLIRDLMAGVARGTAAVLNDPTAAVKAIEGSNQADPEATPKTIRAEVEATLPLLSRTGYLKPARVANLESWMREEGLIRRQPSVSKLLTDEYLASP